jgi:NAD(P)-dependent dehydrogenase (short-subunit alcohol dehydrogenase family)
VARIILLTGASSGIGRACAALLAEHGDRVYGTSRQPGGAPAGCTALELDVTDDASVRRAVAEVLAREGRIDVLINNAGHALAGALEDTSIAEAQRQLDTNFFGVVRMCQAVLPAMRAQQGGLILNMGSLAGVLGLPFQSLYSASKFALEGLTESLRLEVRPFGIHVAVLEPGDVCTPITDHRTRAARATADSPYAQPFATAMRLIEHSERTGGAPEQVARHVLAVVRRRGPRVRSSAGPLAQRVFAAAKPVLPSRLFETLVRRFYGL